MERLIGISNYIQTIVFALTWAAAHLVHFGLVVSITLGSKSVALRMALCLSVACAASPLATLVTTLRAGWLGNEPVWMEYGVGLLFANALSALCSLILLIVAVRLEADTRVPLCLIASLVAAKSAAVVVLLCLANQV